MYGSTTMEVDQYLYDRLKDLQLQLEFCDIKVCKSIIQEKYIKEEHKNLKRELIRAREEIKRIQSVPLVIGQFLDMVDKNYGIISSTAGSKYHVRILSTINR